jgi:uncharacterized repeat protein (TIGR02543 family)
MKTRKILCLLLTSLMLTSLFIITQISSVSAVSEPVATSIRTSIRNQTKNIVNEYITEIPATNPTVNQTGNTVIGGGNTKDYREGYLRFDFPDDNTGNGRLANIALADANTNPIELELGGIGGGTSSCTVAVFIIPASYDEVPSYTKVTSGLTPGPIDVLGWISNATSTDATITYKTALEHCATARETLQWAPDNEVNLTLSNPYLAAPTQGAPNSGAMTFNVTDKVKAYFTANPTARSIGFIATSFSGNLRTASSARLNVPKEDVRDGNSFTVNIGDTNRYYADVNINGTWTDDKIFVAFKSNSNEFGVIEAVGKENSTTLKVTVPNIPGHNENYDITVSIKNKDNQPRYSGEFTGKTFYTNTVYFESNGGVQKDNTGGNQNKMIKALKGIANGQPLFTSETVIIEEDGEPPISFEERTSIIPEITKKYYTFDGWYKDSGFVTPWVIGNETEDDNYDTVNGDITLYAKWTAESTEADGSKLIDLPSFDAFTRVSDNTINARTVEQVMESANVVKYQDNSVAPSGGQLALGYRGDSYREAYFRYDLSAADIDAILRAEGTSYTNGEDGRTGNKAVFEFTAYSTTAGELIGNKTVNAYFLPANKVSGLHNSYATANSTNGEPYELSQTIGFNYVTAIENGLTVRDNTDLRNAGPVASVSYEVVSGAENQIIQLDLTEALQKYFAANPGVTNFGFVLTNVDSTNNLCGIYNSKFLPATYRPKLYIPAPREAAPETDIIPVNQAGQPLSLATLDGATTIIFKDGSSADDAYTSVISFYGEGNKFAGLKVVPAAARFDTPYLTRLNLPEPLVVPTGAVSAKIILIDGLGGIKPVKDFKLIGE